MSGLPSTYTREKERERGREGWGQCRCARDGEIGRVHKGMKERCVLNRVRGKK